MRLGVSAVAGAYRRRYRILHILEATVGGTREHILQILRGLDRSRFALSLICSLERNPRFAQDIAHLREMGIQVYVIPMRREIRPWADFVAFLRILAHLMRHRYDAVHTHSSKAGFLGRLAAWVCGVRRIYHTPHVYYFQWRPHTLAGRFFRLLEWFAACMTTRVIAVSETQREIMIRCGVVRPRRAVFIGNGVDVALFRNDAARMVKRQELGVSPDILLVGTVGRLEPQKGCEHFIRAAQLVANEMANVRFVVVGEGSIGPQLRDLARQLNLVDVLYFLGHRDDLPELYHAFDLFVLTSLWEGMPYVILEAMAAGLPTIASDVPGSRDLVRNGATGFLVPPEHERIIAARVLYLLRAPALRREMGRRARMVVEQSHTQAKFLAELTRLYERTLP